jgi:hypothetical protein
MHDSYQKALADPGSLLRPWAMDPERADLPRCLQCLGVVDYIAAERAHLCRRCGARQEAAPEEEFLQAVRLDT